MILTPEVRKNVRSLVFALPAVVFMTAVFAVPLMGILWQSITTQDGSQLSFAPYRSFLSTALFLRVSWTTVEVSLMATAWALLLGYPIAYFMSKQPPRRRAMLMMLVLIPFWTSVLVKSFAFMVVLGQSGLINQLLAVFGLGPLRMIFNRFGVIVGMSHFLVPFMVFTTMTSLVNQPPELARAAAIMGAGRLRIFWRVTLPLSLPGVMAGCLLVFVLSLGFYVVPAVLGGRRDMMLGNLVYFYARETLNWPMASAISVLLMSAAALSAFLLAKIPGSSSILSKEAH